MGLAPGLVSSVVSWLLTVQLAAPWLAVAALAKEELFVSTPIELAGKTSGENCGLPAETSILQGLACMVCPVLFILEMISSFP